MQAPPSFLPLIRHFTLTETQSLLSSHTHMFREAHFNELRGQQLHLLLCGGVKVALSVLKVTNVPLEHVLKCCHIQ